VIRKCPGQELWKRPLLEQSRRELRFLDWERNERRESRSASAS
jgi:hypothetical protein